MPMFSTFDAEATLAKIHGEQPVRPFEALEFDLAALSEGNIRAGHELADEARDEHLAGDGVARESGRVVDSRSVEVICLVKRVARVRADADAQWWRCVRKRGVNRHVDRSRTRNGTPRTRKGEHRTVALSLDNRPTVCCGRISDYLVVLADDVEPAVIAQPSGQDGRVDDVREDDRHRSIGGERLAQIGRSYRTFSSSCSRPTVSWRPSICSFVIPADK